MKNLILLSSLFISSNAFSEDFDFNAFARELEELESSQVLSAPKVYVDEITNSQAANLKLQEPDAVEMDEVYKIIPLPGLEDQDAFLETNKASSAPKRVRSK